MRFALMEAKVALSKLLLAADLEVVPGHENIKLDENGFLLRPMDGEKLKITPRKKD